MKKFVLGMFLTSLLIPCSSECSVSLSKKATIKEASSDPYLLKIYNCEDYIYEDEETGVTMVDEFEEWYDQLGGDASPLADAIIDRIAHDSYRINITSIDAEHDISMREVYGLDKALRE